MPAGAGIAMLRDEDPALAAALLARQQRRPPRWTVAAGPRVKRGAPMRIRKSLSIVAVTAVLMVPAARAGRGAARACARLAHLPMR